MTARARREHENVTIWCGTLFEGGCGRRLTTRLYTDKICHFAHYASDGSEHRCGRKERGRDDANHLFAKAHLESWLRAQGITAEFTYPEPRGSAVLARVEDGRTLLVYLDRDRPVAWETILGPGVRTAPDVLAQRGYVHRVRFEDRGGGGRTMKFDTQIPGEATAWEDLDDVMLTSEGLTTPRRTAATPAPADTVTRTSAPAGRTIVTVARPTAPTAPAARQTDPVRKALRDLDLALRDHPSHIPSVMRSIRQLLEAEDRTRDETAVLRNALVRGEKALDQRARRRRAVLERLKDQPTRELYTQALALMQDPGVTPGEKARVAVFRAVIQSIEAQEPAAKEQAEARMLEDVQREWEPRRVHHARVGGVEGLVPVVRGALKKASREGRTTTWRELQKKTGERQLDRLTHQDKVELLVLVDSKTEPGHAPVVRPPRRFRRRRRAAPSP